MPQGAPDAITVPAGSPSAQDGLRTFILAKPPALIDQERHTESVPRAPLRLPTAYESVRTTVGLGYVQGADWASEMLAGGAFNGVQLQANALITKGSSGVLFDNGSISLFDPDRQWRVEGGDVFSALRGVSRGARVSWPSRGGRHPAAAFYGPRPGTPNRPTVVSYRDQIMVGEQTVLDAEVASDKSYLVRSRLATPRYDVDVSYRSNRRPVPGRDASVFASVTMWRGVRRERRTVPLASGERSP